MNTHDIELPPLPFVGGLSTTEYERVMHDWLRAAIETDRKRRGEPIGEWVKAEYGNYPDLVWSQGYAAQIGAKLYAAPQPAEPDDDFYYKMGCFIDHATGGRLSKLNWPLEALRSAHDDNVQSIVEDALKEPAEPVKVPSDEEIMTCFNQTLADYADGRGYVAGVIATFRALLARYGRSQS